MPRELKIYYHVFLETPEEYKHMLNDMGMDDIHAVVDFLKTHESACSLNLDDFSSFIMSIVFNLNMN